MAISFEQRGAQLQGQELKHSQRLSARQLQSLNMLAMSLPNLRAQLYEELKNNPCIEDIGQTLSSTKEEDLPPAKEVDDYLSDDEYDDGASFEADGEASDRKRAFLESQTKDETLEEHLLQQLAYSEIDKADIPLAEILIGELDRNGYFDGSIPDIIMVTGESEKKILAMLKTISSLDPLGCGARNLTECLLAQVESIKGSERKIVRTILEKNLLSEIAEGRIEFVSRQLGADMALLNKALAALKTLEPKPGRNFAVSGVKETYINPEVHAKKIEGKWFATLDSRSLPEIKISDQYSEMLSDAKTDEKTKDYIRTMILSAEGLKDAISRRQETIITVAQAIFDAQPGFFEHGLKGLKPLTMQEIAERTGLHHATISRTVNDKYASTPRGTVELRRFFVQGIPSQGDGEKIAKNAILDEIEKIVRNEDKSNPLSDDKITLLLQKSGFPVKRRTVAKYRDALGIPGTRQRKKSDNLV
jgi:RNA polymerase sigma-54 factor